MIMKNEEIQRKAKEFKALPIKERLLQQAEYFMIKSKYLLEISNRLYLYSKHAVQMANELEGESNVSRN